MSAKLALLDLIGKLQNAVEVFKYDMDSSEYADDPDVMRGITETIEVIARVMPTIKLTEDLIYGEITPKVYLKKYTPMDPVILIGDEVKDLLKRTSSNGPEGETV